MVRGPLGQLVEEQRHRLSLSLAELPKRVNVGAAAEGIAASYGKSAAIGWTRWAIPQPATLRWLAGALELPLSQLRASAEAQEELIAKLAARGLPRRLLSRGVAQGALAMLSLPVGSSTLELPPDAESGLGMPFGHAAPGSVGLPTAIDRSLGKLVGNLVDLDLEIVIDVGDDGWAILTYRHELLNLTTRPVTRIARQLWFEHTAGLLIAPLGEGDRRVVIQPIHETATYTEFACQVSPPIQPGESAVVQFTCEGGQFVSDHYWRQTLPRHTRHLTISVRHRRGGRLLRCDAVEEQPDGSEQSADTLAWDYKGSDVIITLTRENLLPNQAVTVRWGVNHEVT
jgi:hypothetical protein